MQWYSFVFKQKHLADSFWGTYSNCSSIMSSKPIKHHKQLLIKIKKGPNETAQMNILLIFQIEFLLKLVVRKKAWKKPLWSHIPWPHHLISLSSSIHIEHMSQDTYSLSYGNFTPGRPLRFLYHIMIPTLSLDTASMWVQYLLTCNINFTYEDNSKPWRKRQFERCTI